MTTMARARTRTRTIDALAGWSRSPHHACQERTLALSMAPTTAPAKVM
jgi:hypothetical protein